MLWAAHEGMGCSRPTGANPVKEAKSTVSGAILVARRRVHTTLLRDSHLRTMGVAVCLSHAGRAHFQKRKTLPSSVNVSCELTIEPESVSPSEAQVIVTAPLTWV